MCTLEQPVNMGALDGRNAQAVILILVPEEDLMEGALAGLDRWRTLRAIKVGRTRCKLDPSLKARLESKA